MKRTLLTLILGLSFGLCFGQFGNQVVITTEIENPIQCIPIDIDNDGLLDIVTSSGEDNKMYWLKNLGNASFSEPILLSPSTANFLNILFVDLDTDGDKDILFLRNNPRNLAWLENLDDQGSYGNEQIIIEQDFIRDLVTEDIDNDGDLDIYFSSTNTFEDSISWLENLNGQANFSSPQILLENLTGITSLLLEDIDNDGLKDLICGHYVFEPGRLSWYKRQTDGVSFGSEQIIFQFLELNSGFTSLFNVQFIDVDNDGLKDLTFKSLANDASDSYLNWIKNLNNDGTFSVIEVISIMNGGYRFYDFDNDSDNDLLSWNRFNNTITWKENSGNGTTFSQAQLITNQADFPRDSQAFDIDNDGYLDVLSSSLGDEKIAWYPNFLLSVPENETAIFNAYPNPVVDFLNIESDLAIRSIEVYNVLGEAITTSTNATVVQLATISSGVYFVRITDIENNTQVLKIVKQ